MCLCTPHSVRGAERAARARDALICASARRKGRGARCFARCGTSPAARRARRKPHRGRKKDVTVSRPAKRRRPPHRRKSRTHAIENSSLPSPAGDGPARRARVTSAVVRSALPKSGGQRNAATAPHKRPNQKMRNCKFFLGLQILPRRPRRGRPSAPCARHKRQTIRRTLRTRMAPRRPAQQKKPDLIRTGRKIELLPIELLDSVRRRRSRRIPEPADVAAAGRRLPS